MTRLRAVRPVHLALIIPWLVVVVAGRTPLRDNSFLWHVRAGSVQIERGSVLTQDPFSFTFGGQPWRTQSWLAETLYGWLDGRVGLSHVPWLLVAIGTVIVTAVSLTVYGRSRSFIATAVVGTGTAWTAAAFLSPRPVVFSYALLALVVLAATQKRMSWTIPLLVWVWASVHASFVIGIGFVVVEAIRTRRRDLIRAAFVGGLFSLATAHGWGVVSFLTGFVQDRAALRYLTEWAPPRLLSLPFLLVIPALVMIVRGASLGRLRGWDLLVVAFGLGLIASASRSVFPGWIVLAPYIGVGIHEGDLPARGEVRPVEAALNVVLGLAVLLIPFLIPLDSGLEEGRFPVEAARYLEGANAFHDDVVGGYLIYARWPDVEVFVDDRAELYGEDLFKSTLDTRVGTPSWRDTFAEWGIDRALVRSDDGLATVLAEAGWTILFEDEHFTVFEGTGSTAA